MRRPGRHRWRGGVARGLITLTVTVAPAAQAELPRPPDPILDAAIGTLAQISVRDGRGALTRDLAVMLLRTRRCDRATELLRANPDAFATDADQIADVAVDGGDTACLIGIATVLGKADPPGDGVNPSPAPELYHLAGALLNFAGHGEGGALIRQAEAAMAVPRPSLPPLPDAAPLRLRVMMEGLQLRERMQEKLSGRTPADDRVWEARMTELSLYALSAKAAGQYAATLDRYATAALAAGRAAPARSLDDLAVQSLKLGRRDRAAALMEAAVRNEDDPNTSHSLASRELDALVDQRQYAQAAALVPTIDPAKAPLLVDVALFEIMTAEPAALLQYRSAFDRWSNGDAARAAGWFGNLALELADHGAVGEARQTLASAQARLATAQDGEDWDTARRTAARAAAVLGDDDAAWSLASARRADHDGYVALLSAIASGALKAGREASADRALAPLSKVDAGYVYESALGAAVGASVHARQRIVERALAFAASAEPLQARRIYTSLVRESADQLDLPDMTMAILAAAPPALRGALAVEAAFGASIGAEVAREKHQPTLEAEGRRRESALTHIALAEVATLSADDQVRVSVECANLGDLASSRRVADGITDPSKRERAYITLVGRTPQS